MTETSDRDTDPGSAERGSDAEDRADVKASHGEGKECPECGQQLDDVRKTCANCGYELEEQDYQNPEAGTEFRAGAAVDEEGGEVEDWDPDADVEQGAERDSTT